MKREQRRKKKSLRTQILLKNTEEIGNAAQNVAQTQDLDKENEQPKKKRKVGKIETKSRVTVVKPFSFTLREERKKKEKENMMECSEDDDDDICFKMPIRPKSQAPRKRQIASLSRINELAKPKNRMKKTVSDSSLPTPALTKPKDKSKIDRILAKPKALIRAVKEPTKAVSPKFNLARRYNERRKREEILEKERKKQEIENMKIKEREEKIEEKKLKVNFLLDRLFLPCSSYHITSLCIN